MNMSKNKAPGPDGYTIEFFQASWKFLGPDILAVVEESQIRQQVWSALNSTFFTLIPKTTTSDEPQGFRPIALCNVIYKIISTVIAKRLKPLLPTLIAPEQTGFVEGRQILDGIVVSQEVIHSLKQRKRPGMLMKLDLSKAYDRLHWDYLRAVLEAYGFDHRWIDWIINLVSTPNFSILINGIPSAPFKATRGIRQVDPLSPFLFILAMEGLSRKLKQESRTGGLKGIRLWGADLIITHQQFVDDLMLFGEASLREVRGFKRVLEGFMSASGMAINNDKSCTFIFNTPEAVKAHLTRVLGFRQGELPTRYLGIQLDINSMRIKNWQTLVDRIRKQLQNWSFRILNFSSRVVLLKSVLLSIPIYPLSILPAPKGVFCKLREIFGKFLWEGANQQRKWTLVSWQQVIKRKEEGGLGIRDLEFVNKVLWAKLWWRWVQGGMDIWKRIWTHKYNMPRSVAGHLRVEETPRGSHIWELARNNKTLVRDFAFWEVRDGNLARF